MISKEFDECLRSIVQMDYGIVMISHATDKTFTDELGQEYNQIVPTLDKRARNIVVRMCDFVAYSRAIQDETGAVSTKLFLRGTPRYVAGSRFKYIPNYIDFSYKALVEAIGNAIDEEEKEAGAEFYTSERVNLYEGRKELDFDSLIEQFNTLVNNIYTDASEDEFNTYWQPRIIEITEKYLGKGQKVNQCSRGQVESLDLIVSDLTELVASKK